MALYNVMKSKQSLINRRFSKLTVISPAEPIGYNKRWLCRCDCGAEKIIYQNALSQGRTKSCGCYNKEASQKRMSKGWSTVFTKDFLQEEHISKQRSLREIAKDKGCTVSCVMKYMKKHELQANNALDDLTNQRFEMLTVLRHSHSSNGTSYWESLCDCGNKIIVRRNCLVRHSQISCGCYNRNKDWEGCGDLSKTYWTRLHKSAIKRNLDFNISMEYAWNLYQQQNGICSLSGVPLFMDRSFSQNGVTNKKQTASLDRIDSSRGYIVGNVQWVHLIINRMKSNLDDTEFVDWCNKVVKHHKS